MPRLVPGPSAFSVCLPGVETLEKAAKYSKNPEPICRVKHEIILFCFVWTICRVYRVRRVCACWKNSENAISSCVTWQNIPGFLEYISSLVHGFLRSTRHFEIGESSGDEIDHMPYDLSRKCYDQSIKPRVPQRKIDPVLARHHAWSSLQALFPLLSVPWPRYGQDARPGSQATDGWFGRYLLRRKDQMLTQKGLYGMA